MSSYTTSGRYHSKISSRRANMMPFGKETAAASNQSGTRDGFLMWLRRCSFAFLRICHINLILLIAPADTDSVLMKIRGEAATHWRGFLGPHASRVQRGFPGYGMHARRVRSQAILPMDQPRIFTRVLMHPGGGRTTAHENV